ncbi:MAG TPA: tripartite tricarboxylate transporter substrate binding protein [Beijerinckiaceae bacterium]|jgi:tripartite-type tricarboxylate transporter receptor subunit TctC
MKRIIDGGAGAAVTRRSLVGGALACGLVRPAAAADDYPSRPVRFVLGYAAGSGPDLISRFFADRLKTHLRTVVVENKPGFGGNLGADQVARSKPDGYTLHPTGGTSLAAAPAIYRNVPFDVRRDLVMVAMFARQPTLLVVGHTSPAKTLAELSQILREKGDRGRWGSAIPTARVLGALYQQSIGVKAVEVQYKTSADWIADLNAGSLDFAFIDAASGLGHARQNRIRPLAGSSGQRTAAIPDVPAMREGGVDIDVSSWWCVYAPAQTPDAILDKLHGWIDAEVRSPEAKAFLANIGNDPWSMTRAEAQAYHLEEVDRWAHYAKVAGIEPQG